MARLINGGAYGEARGSVGNTTFSRNASGQIMRMRVVPVNRNSASQQTARAALSENARAWKNLTEAQKASWNNYAGAGFSPIVVKPGQEQSSRRGYQAFCSLRSFLMSVSRKTSDTSVIFGDAAQTYVEQARPLPVVAPLASFDGRIFNASVGINQEGTSLTFANGADIRFDTFSGNYAPGNIFGIAVYISEKLSSFGQRPKNPRAMLYGASPLMDTFAPGPNGDELNIVILPTSGFIGYTNPPQLGEIRRITVYAYDRYGQTALLGSAYVTVAA